MTTVDEFVAEKVPLEFHDIVALLRELMRECAPDASETVSYGMPMWKGRWPLAWISPNKAGITFGFTHGRRFDDPYGLLKGDGKHARHVRIRKLADANEDALRHYIRQALDFDER